ncbi:MAG: EthD family reductase [Oricola sp.]
MPVSMRVIYPVMDGTAFNHDYYRETHMTLVAEHMGDHIQSMVVTRGLAGSPDVPPGFFAVATFVFEDQQTMAAALSKAGPVQSDVGNFTNTVPAILIGEVIA